MLLHSFVCFIVVLSQPTASSSLPFPHQVVEGEQKTHPSDDSEASERSPLAEETAEQLQSPKQEDGIGAPSEEVVLGSPGRHGTYNAQSVMYAAVHI